MHLTLVENTVVVKTDWVVEVVIVDVWILRKLEQNVVAELYSWSAVIT